jgi:Methyltransferase FkbM domain
VYRHTTQIRKFEPVLVKLLRLLEKISHRHYSLECIPTGYETAKLISELMAVNTLVPLIKLGEGDGSYFVPKNLDDIGHCISPGYGGMMTFEIDLFERFGIESTIIDRQVPGLVVPGLNFLPYFVEPYTNQAEAAISLDEIIKMIDLNSDCKKDLILQMDIEGNEWLILRSLSVETLKRFRIIAIEFHSLPILRDKFIFDKIVSPTIRKILDLFEIVHVNAHEPSGRFTFDGEMWHWDTLEVTFQRKEK